MLKLCRCSALILGLLLPGAAIGGEPLSVAGELDRIAYAIDGAESSHGQDLSMWRPDPAGPQGPMQVSQKAAIDVGGGDRFDVAQNRAIGRAYLLHLYRRYRDWPDAIVAYNWGIGRVNGWTRSGRPLDSLLPGVANYLHRVLRESGLCRFDPENVSCASPAPARAGRRPDVPRSVMLRRVLRRAELLARTAAETPGQVSGHSEPRSRSTD